MCGKHIAHLLPNEPQVPLEGVAKGRIQTAVDPGVAGRIGIQETGKYHPAGVGDPDITEEDGKDLGAAEGSPGDAVDPEDKADGRSGPEFFHLLTGEALRDAKDQGMDYTSVPPDGSANTQVHKCHGKKSCTEHAKHEHECESISFGPADKLMFRVLISSEPKEG